MTVVYKWVFFEEHSHPHRTGMCACLNPCHMFFAMGPTTWVLTWVQVSTRLQLKQDTYELSFYEAHLMLENYHVNKFYPLMCPVFLQ